LRADLALDALEMAIWSRGDRIGDDLVHHSDRGVQYTSIRYVGRLDEIGADRSVGSKGDSYDNAAAQCRLVKQRDGSIGWWVVNRVRCSCLWGVSAGRSYESLFSGRGGMSVSAAAGSVVR
jgi:transposase InsO family protein